MPNGFLDNKLNSAHTPLILFKQKEVNSKASRRGKLDIVAEILQFCSEQKTKTSVMYNTNLNYAQLKKQLDILVTQGLLIKNSNKFCTTQKGQRFIILFNELNALIEQE
ncbi:MAG: winged helix-turn-helix domain-containing protein [Candidatus Bathyarchaeota archaeon]|nr:winged helix-turn-helix domain-containing protein [Candidatus Bathyarchaeota archaeon]